MQVICAYTKFPNIVLCYAYKMTLAANIDSGCMWMDHWHQNILIGAFFGVVALFHNSSF